MQILLRTFALALIVLCTIGLVEGAFEPALDPYDHVGGEQPLIDPARLSVHSTVNPRLVSNAVCVEDVILPEPRGLSAYTTTYGQILDHEIGITRTGNESWPIAVPLGDPIFDPQGTGVMELAFERIETRPPRNFVTPFLDGSSIYGVTAERLAAIRVEDPESGLLRLTPGNQMLPQNFAGLDVAHKPNQVKEDMFLAGDVRASENTYLSALHTVWVRVHNREALRAHAAGLVGDGAFERARHITVAIMQRITFSEFLPAFLGDAHWQCELSASIPPSETQARDTQLRNVFTAAIYRIGHSMVSNDTLVAMGKEFEVLALRDIFFEPEILRSAPALEPFIRALYDTPARAADTRVVDDLRNILFGRGPAGHDLAALNIQRGRDTGVPPFNDVRQFYGLEPYTSFEELTSSAPLASLLSELYLGGPDKCDTWLCALAEDNVDGGSHGELATESMREQFCQLRNNDPNFWLWSEHLNAADRSYVLAQSMERVLCDVVGGTLCAGGNVWYVKTDDHKELTTAQITAITLSSVLITFSAILLYIYTRTG
jgi:hypothetical protein